MQHGGDADAGTQMPGIGGDRHHCLRGGLEQQGVENGLVLERDVGDPRRQGKLASVAIFSVTAVMTRA
ncbi:hypothetical protein AmDm5_0016 [Acetobacter malorum]|nr:hypothetical protein AmDm5_0016 [Acetobacter malorum]